MLVTICMPCLSNRWLPTTFGVLADDHTCRFHDPACTWQASLRLFLHGFLVTIDEPLTDDEASIAIRISAHLAVRAQHQGRTIGIALSWLTLSIAHDRRVTAGALPTGVAWADT